MAIIQKGSTGLVSDRSFSVSSAKRDKTVFVTLDEQPAKARVVREGFEVPSVKADASRIDALLTTLEVQRPTELPRVLAQGIAAGTRVGQGTEVDLILAPRQHVPLSVFDDIHLSVRGADVEDVLTRVESDTQLRDLVLKYEDADEVTDADRTIITERLGTSADILVDDTNPDTNFRKGFNAARTALAFK